MEPIEILFKEYDTLRAEILAAINNMHQVIGFGVALGTALLSWSASKGLVTAELTSKAPQPLSL
jgi:hypothetical protein